MWLDKFDSIFNRGWVNFPDPMKIQGAGDKFKLTLSFSDQLTNFDYPFLKKKSAAVNFMVNQLNSSHAIFWNKIEAVPGNVNELVLVPTLVDANGALIDIDLDKRQCKFDAEGNRESKMFTMYTQESCDFECMASKAMTVCGYCIPWNLPQVHESEKDKTPAQ